MKKSYVIQALERGKWKNMEKHLNRKNASLAYDDYKRFYNKVRVKKGNKILHRYTYKLEKAYGKKPYFIPEPYGAPFELQPAGKFRLLPSMRKKMRGVI